MRFKDDDFRKLFGAPKQAKGDATKVAEWQRRVKTDFERYEAALPK